MEHRWGERVKVELPVRISTHQGTLRTGKLLNLSASGAFLKVDFPMRALLKIQVIVEHTPRVNREAQAIAAYVTRCLPNGVAIEWCEFAPPPITQLLQTLTAQRHKRLRKLDVAPAVSIPRLSTPLLNHGT